MSDLPAADGEITGSGEISGSGGAAVGGEIAGIGGMAANGEGTGSDCRRMKSPSSAQCLPGIRRLQACKTAGKKRKLTTAISGSLIIE